MMWFHHSDSETGELQRLLLRCAPGEAVLESAHDVTSEVHPGTANRPPLPYK